MSVTQKRAPAHLPPYSTLQEPYLLFDANRTDAVDQHPLRGLITHGPYSEQVFTRFTPAVRIATVGPESGTERVRKLLSSLRSAHHAADKSQYTPDYPGFGELFKADLLPAAPAGCHIKWPERIEDMPGEGSGAERLAQAFNAALQQLETHRGEFELVTIHLPDNWDPVTRTKGFDAHDVLKALAATRGIPTQVLNDATFEFGYVAQRSWRLAIACYVKAGGVPWKLAPLPGVPERTAYIGLGYAFRGDPREARFVTCCSQVFDTDGGGMQFVAYEARDPIAGDRAEARRNPYLSRDDMRSVLARSLRVYQSRNGGSIPHRVVLHKTTPFRDEEIAGAKDAFAAVREVECIELTSSTSWRGVWLQASRRPGQRSEPDGYPTPRGVLLPVSGTEALLWAAGNAPGVSPRGNYYQGGKSIPRPLLLRRHAGSGPLELAGSEALALTKMDWNNDALYDPVPVTIQYSSRLARAIARGPMLGGTEFPYRLFM
jgi:hypothetical protein